MKRKFIVSLLLIVMLLVMVSAVFVGCNKGEQLDYTVTVMYDGQYVSGITVNWSTGSSVKGSAVTGEDGKATVSLTSGTYDVTLLGYEDGLTYTRVSVNASMRNVMLELSIEQVTYTATVITKDGNPASNVTVNWMKGNEIKKSATTGADGKASVTLDYGDYTVMVANLPEGNIFTGSLNTTPSSANVQFNLVNGVTVAYSVTMISEGGLLFKDTQMVVFQGDLLVVAGPTNDQGVFNFSLQPGDYTIEPLRLIDGYTYTAAELTAETRTATLTMYSAPIKSLPSDNVNYVIGDIIHDYTFSTPYDYEDTNAPKTATISEVLKDKQAIFINNWGTQCTWCMQEFPAMREAYEKYQDQIEIIAVSNYMGGDTVEEITTFYEENKDKFILTRDTYNFALKFAITNFPTTIVIDRYGAIARIEVGAILDAETWGRLIEKYIGDDYVQTFIPGTHESDSINNELAKPDVVLDPDHYDQVANAMNNFEKQDGVLDIEYYGEPEYEYAWPFILGAVDGVSVDNETLLYASNSAKANSMAIIYAKVTMPVGKVLTFDYFCDTQLNGDILSVYWDGKIIEEFSGNSDGWKTCYLYADIIGSEHTLALSYIKDRSVNTGKDNVYFKNIRFVELSAITEPTDMLRSAAYGTPEANATQYPNYANVEIGSDGYYHVILSSLTNSEYAGDDSSPMLFVNMLGATNWSSLPLNTWVNGVDVETGDYAVNISDEFREELNYYINISAASDIYGFLPVDKELHDLLVEFMQAANIRTSHSREWLETCYFYSHYNVGNEESAPIGNPIWGLTEKTAVEIVLNGTVNTPTTTTADLTRVIFPYPYMIYKFTVPADGVYKITSLIEEDAENQDASQIWLYDNVNSTVDEPLIHSDETHVTITAENEYNFEIYRYMTTGEVYYICVAFQMQASGVYDFTITNVGASATVLLPCSDNIYDGVLDSSGNITNLTLAGAVDYEYDANADRYYALNPNGTRGDIIYLNVGYEQLAVMKLPFTELVDEYVLDPANRNEYFEIKDGTNAKIPMFDFSRIIVYFPNKTNPSYLDYGVSDNLEDSVWDNAGMEIYKGSGIKKNIFHDYTQFVREVIATDTDNDGLVPVTKDIMEFLSLYLKVRNNALYLDSNYNVSVWEDVAANEWLRFCWYYRTYNSTNV